MSEQPPPAAKGQTGRVSIWLLGVLSAFGLVGFVVAFGLIVARTAPMPEAATISSASPPATVQGTPGPRGERGPPGPAGPAGPAGNSGVRIVRAECPGGNCTVECEANEMLLMAHCGAGRGQATLQTERSALCRAPARVKTEMIAACTRTQ